MIQVDDLSMAYGGKFLFKDASFTLQKKERCGLVGINGSGKSTLFRLLLGEEIPDSGAISIGKQYSIGSLKQHLSFTEKTLLAEASTALPPEERDSPYRVEAILFGLGFKEKDLARAPSEFSGGYQLRLHLTKLLVQEPDCLLLDEPTNYLDIVSIRWLTRFLQNWRGEMLLISHDREFMDQVSTHTMGIHRGQIRKIKGGTAKYFESILQEEEVYEKTRLNIEKKKAHLQGFIDRFGAKASKAVQAQARQKMIDKIPALEKLKSLHALDFEFALAPFSGKKMVDMKDISFKYGPEEPMIIENFSLEIEKGERIAIIGKNGRGKSTLLKLVAGELPPLSGQIKRGDNVSMGYFGQTNIDRLHPEHTIMEEIQLANSRLTQTEVRSICGVMLFSSDQAKKKNGILSGGEKSRVLLGKILATPCNLLLLDEPTHHLDMESIEALVDALEVFEGSVVFVTHSELILRQLDLGKVVLCSENKQEIFLGNYTDFLEKKGWGDESAKEKKKEGGQKEAKINRTGQTTKNAQALKQLDQKMMQLEARISSNEVECENAQKSLVEASLSGYGSEIQKLSIAIAAQKSTIDALYTELENLMQEREAL